MAQFDFVQQHTFLQEWYNYSKAFLTFRCLSCRIIYFWTQSRPPFQRSSRYSIKSLLCEYLFKVYVQVKVTGNKSGEYDAIQSVIRIFLWAYSPVCNLGNCLGGTTLSSSSYAFFFAISLFKRELGHWLSGFFKVVDALLGHFLPGSLAAVSSVDCRFNFVPDIKAVKIKLPQAKQCCAMICFVINLPL